MSTGQSDITPNMRSYLVQMMGLTCWEAWGRGPHRTLEALRRRGLVRLEGRPRERRYVLTDAGRAEAQR
jgi:hypothetical protein